MVSLWSRLGCLGCPLGLGGSSGVSVWAGLVSLGPLGHRAAFWGASRVSVFRDEVPGTPAVSMRAWMGSLGSLCGLGSLGPKGSLSGPGWGIWGLSLGQAGVSGNPGVSLSSRLGSLGCSLDLGGSSGVSAWVGLGSLGPQGSLSAPGRGLWGLSLGLLWVSEAFGTPRVFTFSVLAFPGPLGCLSGRAGVSVVSGSLFRQAGVSGFSGVLSGPG